MFPNQLKGTDPIWSWDQTLYREHYNTVQFLNFALPHREPCTPACLGPPPARVTGSILYLKAFSDLEFQLCDCIMLLIRAIILAFRGQFTSQTSAICENQSDVNGKGVKTPGSHGLIWVYTLYTSDSSENVCYQRIWWTYIQNCTVINLYIIKLMLLKSRIMLWLKESICCHSRKSLIRQLLLSKLPNK